MALTKDEVLRALWEKHEAIYHFLNEMNRRLKPGERSDYEGVLANGELEMDWVWAMRDEIKYGGTLAYPTDDQVRSLASATSDLQQITDRNSAYEALANAAIELINTWPVSGGEPEE